MPVLILHHPDCLKHEMGQMHPERPERVKVIQSALEMSHFREKLVFQEASLVEEAALLRVHDKAYLEGLYAQSPKTDYVSLDPDTLMNPFTLQAARRASGSMVDAVEALEQGYKKVFCNVRPPGHHAEHDLAMGFCFFNHIAVGVAHALAVHNMKKIAVVDFDVHHGNGTHDIFTNNPKVLLCSSFEHPFYPARHLESNEHILHTPCPAGLEGPAWRAMIEPWFENIRKFKPDCLFVSAGFDAHYADPLADLNLNEQDYVWVAEQLCRVAEKTCSGRVISILEGGYDLEALKRSVPAYVEVMTEYA